MTSTLACNDFITINTVEKDDYYIIDVAGEIIGNSAERLINLIDDTYLKTTYLKLLLDLSKVTYINSYSFGIIAHLWSILRENGRKLFIVANAMINEKFDRFGFNEKVDLKIISLKSSASSEMPF
jgi:anti-anti-sigma factor